METQATSGAVMFSKHALATRGFRLLVISAVAAAAGCSGGQSTQQRIQLALEQSGAAPTPLHPLAGTVTIDAQPPTFDDPRKHLVLVLYDPKEPEFEQHCLAREDGTFRFTEDGIAPGHYILLFAVLKRKGQGNFVGPDQLGNLYNDPDMNAKSFPQFVIDHQAPGKKDYEFNLEVAGKPPVASAGLHAVTKVGMRRQRKR
jgi:hypothetical protein